MAQGWEAMAMQVERWGLQATVCEDLGHTCFWAGPGFTESVQCCLHSLVVPVASCTAPYTLDPISPSCLLTCRQRAWRVRNLCKEEKQQPAAPVSSQDTNLYARR